MKKKFYLILAIISIFGVLTVSAEYDEDNSSYWSSTQESAIGNVKKIYIKFNTDKTIYCDLPLDDESNRDGRTTVKKLERWILKAMNDESNSIEFMMFDEDEKINGKDFIATIFFKDITERGGVTCRMELIQVQKPNDPKVYNIKVKDRKWNDTESLLKENAPKLGELIESDLWWTSRNGRNK